MKAIVSVDPGEHTGVVVHLGNDNNVFSSEMVTTSKVRDPGDFQPALDSIVNLLRRYSCHSSAVEHSQKQDLTVVCEDQFWMPGRSIASLTALVERRSWVQGALSAVYPNARHVVVQPGVWMRGLGIEKGADRELWFGQNLEGLWRAYRSELNEHTTDAFLIGHWWLQCGQFNQKFENGNCAKERPKKKRKLARKPKPQPCPE